MADIVWLPPVKNPGAPSVTLMDAMETLVRWNRKEKFLLDECHRAEPVTYGWVEKIIGYYGLSHILLHKNRQTKRQQQKLVKLLSEYKNKKNTIDHVTVLAHELEPFTQYGKDKKVKNDLQTASLFMWYFNQLDIIQHNSASKESLEYLIELDNRMPSQEEMESDIACEAEFEIHMEEEGEMELAFELEIPLDLNAYFDFHQCWIDMYIEHAAEIKIICDNLFQLCDYESLPETDDYFCLNKEWFHRHVFATWLRNLRSIDTI